MTDFDTGYRIDLEEREQLYAEATPFTGFDGVYSLPEEVDSRLILRKENQSRMGSCRGWSGSTGCEWLFYVAMQQVIQFSAMWLYLRTQSRDRLLGSDQGATIYNGIKVLTEEGICTELVFPYPNPVRYSTRIPTEAFDDAKKYKAGKFSKAPDVDAVHLWIGGGQGYLDFGAAWPFQHSNGIVTSFRPTGRGGHAMCFTGYIKHQHYGRLWICNNSHGLSSGDQGIFYFTDAALQQLLDHSRTSAVLVSDLTTPEPRMIDFHKSAPYA